MKYQNERKELPFCLEFIESVTHKIQQMFRETKLLESASNYSFVLLCKFSKLFNSFDWILNAISLARKNSYMRNWIARTEMWIHCFRTKLYSEISELDLKNVPKDQSLFLNGFLDYSHRRSSILTCRGHFCALDHIQICFCI